MCDSLIVPNRFKAGEEVNKHELYDLYDARDLCNLCHLWEAT